MRWPIACAIVLILLGPTSGTVRRPTAIEFAAKEDGHGAVLFDRLGPWNTPSTVAVADDGAIWFRERLSWHPRIARIGTDGTLREYWDPIYDYRNGQGDRFFTSGAFTPDGDGLLVGPVENGPTGLRIRRVDRDGRVGWRETPGCFAADESFACLASHRGDPRTAIDVHPNFVAQGPRGDLWFTSVRESLIGRLSVGLRRTIFTHGLTRWHSGPQFIATGPDGNMWFTEIRDRVGRITPDGRITEFSAGIPRRASLGGIVAGHDGNMWFTLYHGMVLGAITMNGRVTLYHDLVYPSAGHDFDPLSVIARDRMGRLIYNESQAGRIARVTLARAP